MNFGYGESFPSNSHVSIMNNDESVSLLDTLLAIDTKDQLSNFLKDLYTPAELRSLDERWKVCQLLAKENLSYREIHAITGASLTTIGRVARFLKRRKIWWL